LRKEIGFALREFDRGRRHLEGVIRGGLCAEAGFFGRPPKERRHTHNIPSHSGISHWLLAVEG
jgi:hypothetical protein